MLLSNKGERFSKGTRLGRTLLPFKVHMLYLNRDRTLHDCNDIESGDVRDSELVQDYKRLSKKLHQSNGQSHTPNGRSKRASLNNKPAKPKQFLYTRSDSSASSEDEEPDRCDLSFQSTCLSDRSAAMKIFIVEAQ